MADDLKLRVLFDFVDKVTKPLKGIVSGNREYAKSLKEARDQLKELSNAQRDVAKFREMRNALGAIKSELTAAQARVKTLADEMNAAGTPTKAMARDLSLIHI